MPQKVELPWQIGVILCIQTDFTVGYKIQLCKYSPEQEYLIFL